LWFPLSPNSKKSHPFLSSVDERIELLDRRKEKLEAYKKGVMQQIFSQQIRFRQDDGSEFPDWEERKLGEVSSRVTRKNKENIQNVLTISGKDGLINQMEYFNHSVSARNVTGYYLLQKGEFAYNKSYSNGYPMGAIKRLNRYDMGVVSTLYICFKLEHGLMPNFYEHYFESGIFNHEISKIAQEGARNHGLLNVSVVEFFRDLYLTVPTIEEQKKVAGFFDALDKKLKTVDSHIMKLKHWKKGLLQQMFV
jgi:type I restriction enzyme, S subunit